MTYKFLNTIIDDLFAFVIKMPTMHRLSVFRYVDTARSFKTFHFAFAPVLQLVTYAQRGNSCFQLFRPAALINSPLSHLPIGTTWFSLFTFTSAGSTQLIRSVWTSLDSKVCVCQGGFMARVRQHLLGANILLLGKDICTLTLSNLLPPSICFSRAWWRTAAGAVRGDCAWVHLSEPCHWG
jgi:hypothetical protein